MLIIPVPQQVNIINPPRRKAEYYTITFKDGKVLNLTTYGTMETETEYIFSVADHSAMATCMYSSDDSWENYIPHKHVSYLKSDIMYITHMDGER